MVVLGYSVYLGPEVNLSSVEIRNLISEELGKFGNKKFPVYLINRNDKIIVLNTDEIPNEIIMR